jgi:murein DD-endopeptidase MepM/ murein hydrolase activator NlpD
MYKRLISLFTLILFIGSLTFVSVNAIAYDPNNPTDVYEANSNSKKKISELTSSQEGALAQLQLINAKVDDLENSQIPAAKAALETANTNFTVAQEKAEAINNRLNAAAADKARIEKQLEIASTQYDASKVAVSALAREEMRGSDEMLTAQMIFDSQNSDQFVDAIETSESAARTQTRLLNYSSMERAGAMTKEARLKIVNALIEKLKIEADENERAAKQAQIDAQNFSAKLEKMEADLKASKADLEAKKADIERQIAAEKAHQAQIDADMARLAAASKSGGGSYSKDGSNGYFSYPVDNHGITSYYGWRSFGDFHTGIDFGYSHCGDRIYAAADGKVTNAARNGYAGAGMVTIDHGMHNGTHWATRYLHMASFAVSAGATVKRGQLIAWVASTGWSTGCHLHFEVWQNGHHINPLSAL